MIERMAGLDLGHHGGPARRERTLPRRSGTQLPSSSDRVTLHFSGKRGLFQVLLEMSAKRVRDSFSAKATSTEPEGWPEVNSAESAASRIVSFAADALSSSGQHRSLKELNGKVAKLKSSIDEGFNQALELLSAMGVRSGDLHVGMAEAYRLVMEGIRSFYWEEAKGLEEEVKGV